MFSGDDQRELTEDKPPNLLINIKNTLKRRDPVMNTTLEHFRDAVLVLVGAGPVKQRLLKAFHEHLGHLSPDELPRDLRDAYATLAVAFHSTRRTGSLDAVSASVMKMSEAEACLHAQSVVRMFGCLNETLPANRPGTLLRAVPDEQEIPAFLNRA
jgi:hypothetical protein